MSYKYKGGGEFPDYVPPEQVRRNSLGVVGGVVHNQVRNGLGEVLESTPHPQQGWAECREALADEKARQGALLDLAAQALLTQDQVYLSHLRCLASQSETPLVFRVTASNSHYYLDKGFGDGTWDSWGSFPVGDLDKLAHEVALIQSQGYSLTLPE